MKCPYRNYITESVSPDSFGGHTTKHDEYFEDCYEEDCPYYAKAEDDTAICNKAYADLTSYMS